MNAVYASWCILVWSSDLQAEAHLMQAVWQQVKAVHMGQTQQAAEKALQSRPGITLLLEAPALLEQALTASVQHPLLGTTHLRARPRAFM